MAPSKLWSPPHLAHRGRVWWSDKFGDGPMPPSVRRRKGVKRLSVDKRISPNFEDIGRRSSYFFLTDSSHYLKRHVETLQIKSPSFARRRLTVDVQLPSDGRLGESGEHGDYEFWIPVTFLTKRPPRSNIDLRDDRNRVVPLLTRSENNEISLAAALAGAEELLGSEPSQLLKALLAELVKCDGIKSEVSLVLAKEALKSEGARLGSERALAFAESLRVLSGNYSMWVGFHGRPGERRVIKFHYDIEFDRQGVLRQRPTTQGFLIFGRQSEVTHRLDLEELGDGNPYSPIRRVAARIASATGLGAVNVGIESPYIVGSDSYHLQVESPPGVETRDIDLFATVEEEGDVDSWKRDHGVHLYVNRARLAEEGAGMALLTLRIGRRGFMTLSWLSVVLSATILWLFDLTAKSHFDSPEATAAVLLFGPALLAALVVRPGEHPVATKLFSGIRLLVALNGILVVAAAAAVAGVRPEGWNAEHVWFISAIIASGSAAVVSLGWVFSWDTTYRLVKGLRRQLSTGKAYRRLCAWLLGSTAFLFVFGWLNRWIGLSPAVYLAPATAWGLACIFVAAGYAGLRRSSALLAAVAINVNCLALLAALGALVLQLRSGWQWEAWWLRLAVVPMVGLLAMLLNDRRWRRKHAGEPRRRDSVEVGEIARRWLREVDPKGLNWLRQTPSGARIREEARKNATGIPDLLAPSAYREVEPSEELIDEGSEMYGKFERAWAAKGLEEQTGSGPNGSEAAESLARQQAREDGRREFVVLDL
jgi:hypothetical protein